MSIFCVYSSVSSTITYDRHLVKAVGQRSVFMWNSTTRISFVKWGIKHPKVDSVETFLYVDPTKVFYNYYYLNASNYYGRVSFVGDLNDGKAWFAITNLVMSDANYYSVQIQEGRQPTVQFLTTHMEVNPGN